MSRTLGLASRICRLRLDPVRAQWAPRAARSFATTSHVLRVPPELASYRRAQQAKDSRARLLETETDDVRRLGLRKPAIPSTQSIARDAHLETGVGFSRDTSLFQASDDTKAAASDNAIEEWTAPQRQPSPVNEDANTDHDEPKRQSWASRMGPVLRGKVAEQDFHTQLHAGLLKTIRNVVPVLRGMPVYDSAFDAVRSGGNLFMKTEREVRSLQYMLPLIQSILEFGVWKRRREVTPGHQLPPRPSSLLLLCPTLGEAEDVQRMSTRLVKHHGFGIEAMALSVPNNKLMNALKTQGFTILTSTPEIILHWLALHHAKVPLDEALQDVQTLVVDGKASSLRDRDFLEVLKAVMEDLPLSSTTHRVIISDEYDPHLDGRLTEVVFDGDHKYHQDPQPEEIQELQRAQEKKSRQRRKNLRSSKGQTLTSTEAGLWQS